MTIGDVKISKPKKWIFTEMFHGYIHFLQILMSTENKSNNFFYNMTIVYFVSLLFKLCYVCLFRAMIFGLITAVRILY